MDPIPCSVDPRSWGATRRGGRGGPGGHCSYRPWRRPSQTGGGELPPARPAAADNYRAGRASAILPTARTLLASPQGGESRTRPAAQPAQPERSSAEENNEQVYFDDKFSKIFGYWLISAAFFSYLMMLYLVPPINQLVGWIISKISGSGLK